MLWIPCLVRSTGPDGEVRASLGDPLVDDYLRFVAARSRPNTVLATAYDLKVFFSVVGKEPARVSTTDVMEFLAVQRAPRRGARVVRLEDGESGLSARTLKRRLASVSGLFAYLLVRDDVDVRRNPVPRGVGARRPLASGARGVPLIRTPRTLPRVLSPVEVDALLGALRTHRDRALVLAMLLGGLRRCEVLGLRMSDVHVGSGGCSSPRVRVGISGSCRWRVGSSRVWPTTSTTNAQTPMPSTCSWCYVARPGVGP